MSELKEAAWPWSGHDCGGGTTQIIAFDGAVVAAVWHSVDAPLIAAAPDLYIALEYAYKFSFSSTFPEDVQKMMAEALKKAEGKA